MFRVQGIDHVGLAVRNVQKSVQWYQEMFGLERLYEDVWGDFPGVVGLGETSVAFFPTNDPDIPLPAGLPIHHLAMLIESTSKRLRKRSDKKGLSLSSRIIKLCTQFTFTIPMDISLN